MRHVSNSALNYVCDVFAKEDAELAQVGSDLPEPEMIMQTTPLEGKLLQVLIKMIHAKKVVEIGVLAGYSTIWMARGLPEDGMIYGIEKNYKRVQPSLKNFARCDVSNKITLVEGEATEVLPTLEPHAPFDVVFIDADKGNYCHYLDWAEKNVRQGGLIIGDNSFLFGAVYGETERDIPQETIDVMNQFNERLADPKRFSAIQIPTQEGMTVAMKL